MSEDVPRRLLLLQSPTMTTYVLLAAIMLTACFVQSTTGFGMVLVAMPLLIDLFGVRTAAPLMAVMALFVMVVMIVHYRHALNLRTVWRLSAASIVGIPIGVFYLSRVPESIALTLLGVVLIGYVLLRILPLPLPRLEDPRWAYLFGFSGGLLSGSYNASGPPMVIYGNIRGWTPQVFKANLQGYFFVNSIFTTATHVVTGHVTAEIFRSFLIALPFLLIGTYAGFALDQYVDSARFARIILVLLLVLGVRLSLSWM